MQYGIKVAPFLGDDPKDRIDPMSRVFPKMTKCSYKKYGLSGSIQTFDALCMLPVNVMNEKIYVFTWFWLIFLVITTVLYLMYHLLLAFHPNLLHHIIKIRVRHNEGLKYILDDITKQFKFGDWRLLQILAYNISPLVFGEFLLELDSQMAVKEAQQTQMEKDLNEKLKTPDLSTI